MDVRQKHCVINAVVGDGWYEKGQERLVRSLIYHGFTGDILTWKQEFPMKGYDETNPYNIKAAAFEYAIEQGYTDILWLDASVWAIGYLMPVFDCILDDGYYMWPSGYDAAQTCSDKCLAYFGIDRDEAEKIKDCSSSMLGVNVGHPVGGEFIRRFIQACKDGVAAGSRHHDNQSEDKRFMFHRQDQSVATVIAGQLGMKLTPSGVFSWIYDKEGEVPETVLLTMKGM